MSHTPSASTSSATARTRRNLENTLNRWVCEWLETSSGRQWEAAGEELGLIQGSTKRPDLVVIQGDRMPVVVEFEVGRPAVGDASGRLGKCLVGNNRPFTEALAVGYREDCRGDDRESFMRRMNGNEAFMSVQIVSRGNGVAKLSTWPDSPIPASAEELMAYIEYLQVPQDVIEARSREIAEKIQSAGISLHDSIRMTAPSFHRRVMDSLRRLTGAEHIGNRANGRNSKTKCPKKCGHDAQAVQTTCAIWLVAIDLQNDLAQHSENLIQRGLEPTASLMSSATSRKLTAGELLKQWRTIREIDYHPVIDVAIEALETCEDLTYGVPDVLGVLHEQCLQTNALHAKHVYNFAGELWQRLVADREERAAHYTKPQVAELLATLAAERFADLEPERIAELNIMDAACGTGTLVGAGERAIRRKYYNAGGKDPSIHSSRMEDHIFAMDINGIAGALTAKRLTDIDLERDYTRSQIAVITHPAGSLMLLDPDVTGVSQVLGYRGVTPTTGPGGDEGVFHIPDRSIDWALMNPPYSRPRGGRRQATTGLEPLRNAAKKRGYNMSHGLAGIATDFGDLSNIRLKPGGVFAHVLPITAARAPSWKNWRSQIENDFRDIIVITARESMSADTDLGEMLLIATKRRGANPIFDRHQAMLCVNLTKPLTKLTEGYAVARQIARISPAQSEGMISGGTYTWVAQGTQGNPWSEVGSSDTELTAVLRNLLAGVAWDPGSLSSTEFAVPMASLGDLATTGPTHHLIGHPKGGDGIGAYEWTPIGEFSEQPSQLAMWSAVAAEQTAILTSPTHGGRVSDQTGANNLVSKRSRWFIKRGMRWTSQATSIAQTIKPVHGGRAWTALLGGNTDCMKAVALFLNSTFGAIIQNGYGAIQQRGRSQIQVQGIADVPCPAFNARTPQAKAARKIASDRFSRLNRRRLKPFAACVTDENRKKIDRAVAEMLGLDPTDSQVQSMLDRYRVLFARQPNVNGGQRRYLKATKDYDAGPA